MNRPPSQPWDDTFSVDEIREYIRKLSDRDLLSYGRAARYMTTSGANPGRPPRKVFQVQLEESRAEWKRRHPREKIQ